MIEQGDGAELIFANALDFLNAGLDILFAANATAREAKVGVISIQTAIELLAKYRLVREHGLVTIVRGVPPEGDLLSLALAGDLRTIGYGECLKVIREDEGFSEIEEELIRRVQQLRNSLVHFAAEVDVERVRMDLAWLLIRALGMFGAGQERDQGEMQTHARFLDIRNFLRLTRYEPYRNEAVDSAIDSPDSEQVLRCWECGVDALSVRPSDTYFCHCCGLTAELRSAAHTDCNLCGQKNGVCFDPLNATCRLYHGRCGFCEEFVGVTRCSECGTTRSQPVGTPAIACTECLDG